MITVVHATTPQQIEQVRILFHEYRQYLGVDLCFQSFAQECDTLPGEYVSPKGSLRLAMSGSHVVGCAALRPLEEEACEMKRLFVRPAHRKKGYGAVLAETIIDDAKKIGYRSMRLDTLRGLVAAIHLYTYLGFKEISSYYPNPLPGVVYMELVLQ